ncbi:MAG: WD40/YVTN/BNR-like repeat-containing protein, partial [Burkholderiales bacterium]
MSKKLTVLRPGKLLLLACCLLLSLPAQAFKDPLEQPARFSAIAARAMLPGVAKAGARLVAVGEHGIIVYSDNRGQSWTQAKVPVSVTLTAVQFPDAKDGWAVGHDGVVLSSTDGGQSWV